MGARIPSVLTYVGRALGKRCLALQLPKHKETYIPHTWKQPAPRASAEKPCRAEGKAPSAYSSKFSFCFKWGVEFILVWHLQLEFPEALKNTRR